MPSWGTSSANAVTASYNHLSLTNFGTVEAEGVNATLSVWPVVPHVWQLACYFLPEGRRSLERTAAFLQGAAQRAASGKTIFASL